jgi:hypothetical protein
MTIVVIVQALSDYHSTQRLLNCFGRCQNYTRCAGTFVSEMWGRYLVLTE